jgi:hypothetical protein
MFEDAEILFVFADEGTARERRGQSWLAEVRSYPWQRHGLSMRLAPASTVDRAAIDAASHVLAVITNADLVSTSYADLLVSLAASARTLHRLALVAREPIDASLLPHELAPIERFDLSVVDDPSVAALTAALTAHAAPVATGESVFVAAVDASLETERTRIERELAGLGHRVVGGSGADASIDALLDDAILSIHLLGRAAAGDATRRAQIAREFRAALDRGERAGDFAQLVWLAREEDALLASSDLVAEAFERAGAGAEVEVLRTGIEDFKTYIADRLRARNRTSTHAPEQTERATLYLMYDRRDEAVAAGIAALARSSGIDVIEPSFDANQARLREHHQQSLRVCDAAMIVYGRVAEPWVRMKQQDLMKAAGFGRLRPMTSAAVFLAPERTASKDVFGATNLAIIRSVDALAPDAAAPFFKQLQMAGVD